MTTSATAMLHSGPIYSRFPLQSRFMAKSKSGKLFRMSHSATRARHGHIQLVRFEYIEVFEPATNLDRSCCFLINKPLLVRCLPLLLINFGTAVRLGTFVRNFHGWISKFKSKSQNDLYLCFSMWVKLMFLIGMKMPIGKDGQVHVSLLEVVNARITKVEGVKLHASSGLMHSLVLY